MNKYNFMKYFLLVVMLAFGSYAFSQGNWSLTGTKNRWANGMGFGNKDTSSYTNASDTNLLVLQYPGILCFRRLLTDHWSVVTYSSALGSYLRISDTSAMLAGYLRKGDTAIMLSGYARNGHVVKYTDTAAILDRAIRNQNGGSLAMQTAKMAINDTAMAKIIKSALRYSEDNSGIELDPTISDNPTLKFKASDNSTRYSFLSKINANENLDTLFLKNLNNNVASFTFDATLGSKITAYGAAAYNSNVMANRTDRSFADIRYVDSSNSLKLSISDTAAMLSNRLKISDTANMLQSYARTANLSLYQQFKDSLNQFIVPVNGYKTLRVAGIINSASLTQTGTSIFTDGTTFSSAVFMNNVQGATGTKSDNYFIVKGISDSRVRQAVIGNGFSLSGSAVAVDTSIIPYLANNNFFTANTSFNVLSPRYYSTPASGLSATYSYNSVVGFSNSGTIRRAYPENEFSRPINTDPFFKGDKTTRIFSWAFSPDTIPSYSTVVGCERQTYNTNTRLFGPSGSKLLIMESGTDTSVVKRTVNGLPYIMFSLDSSQSCNAHRSEIYTSMSGLNSDSIFWIGEVKLIPNSWTSDSSAVIISQIHGGSTLFQDSNSPLYALLVVKDSLFVQVAYNTGVDSTTPNLTRVFYNYFVGKVKYGVPFSYVVKAKLAAYPRTDGYVKVWFDDRLVLDYSGSLGYQLETTPAYKVGIYKWLFIEGYNYHVYPGVQSAKIMYYTGDTRYGNSNSTYQDIRPSYSYTDSVSYAITFPGTITTTGLDNYASNINGSFTSLSKVTKGYADSIAAIYGASVVKDSLAAPAITPAIGLGNRPFYSNAGFGTGGLPSAGSGTSLVGQRDITGATSSQGIGSIGQVQSGVTTRATYFGTFARTAAASFTLGEMTHYFAGQGTIGSGSTVTNQYGFKVASSLTGATNNSGFRGEIASGTGRLNLDMAGTASNYLAGNLMIGSSSDNGRKLQITGTSNFSSRIFASSLNLNKDSVPISSATTLNLLAQDSVTGLVSRLPNGVLPGTLSTAAQPNITSVGTLTGLTVSGEFFAKSYASQASTFTTGATLDFTAGFWINAQTGSPTGILPSASGHNKILTIRYGDPAGSGNTLTLSVADAGNIINRVTVASTLVLSEGDVFTLQSDGSNWVVISRN